MLNRHKSKKCPQCGHLVSKEKFINQEFYVLEDDALVKKTGQKARIQGCKHCIEELKEILGPRLEQTDFENRTIYSFKPNVIEKLATKIKTIIFPPQTHKETTSTQKPETNNES